ncbi:MAG: copper amine oxidase N-terminal domain-containing protein, partial [Defluviitaleaceae bacterium]|nr:copper amine oxidase N-terminal domain-containing protein [Defluviitaleaceae bacterium]
IGSPLITDLTGNAQTQTMDVVPMIQNGRTLLPVRFIANALGAGVDWNDARKEVTLTIDGGSRILPIGIITPELSALGMDVPPQITNGRTMVPLRFISEFFGAVVTWDGETQRIEIKRY